MTEITHGRQGPSLYVNSTLVVVVQRKRTYYNFCCFLIAEDVLILTMIYLNKVIISQ
jgi:hypothetical protein